MYDLPGESMIVKDSILKGLHKPFCGEFNMGGFKLDIFSESINDDEDSIIPV